MAAWLQLPMIQNVPSVNMNATISSSSSSTTASHSTSGLDALASVSGLGTLITLLMSFSGLRDWLKLIVLGGALETLRRSVSSVWEWVLGSFFLTIHLDVSPVRCLP